MTQKNDFLITANLIELNMENDRKEIVLKNLVDKLVKLNYVDDDFLDNLIKREKAFPTGLQFDGIAIAIPHANPENVLKSAISIGICKSTVVFNSMENPKIKLDVKIVIVLALNHPELHLSTMNKLINVFKDAEKIEKIKKSQDENELCLLFNKYLFK